MLTEIESTILLNSVSGLGQSGLRKLIERFGSAQNVVKATEQGLLRERVVAPKIAQNIVRHKHSDALKKEIDLIKQYDVRVLTFNDPNFPQSLRNIPQAPALLYVKGHIPANLDFSLSIVGSRRASVYGSSHARSFAMRLADLGFCVVSGMARGIDTAAHQGVLQAKGKTVAVLGSGLANVYPKQNLKLFEEIIQNGCVISEFPMLMAPLAHNFPRRNRIISGLSMGVIVIEAASRSGALITCDFALEQGKDVFALPGMVDHPNARGVNELIKQGAKLVMDVEDIIEEYTPVLNSLSRTLNQQCVKESSEEDELLSCISERPVHIDHIAHILNQPVSVISTKLLRLELSKKIKQLPGKLFTR